jgi:uncharacterized protein (UPF0297 family)
VIKYYCNIGGGKMDHTMTYDKSEIHEALIEDTLKDIITSLEAKGYNPINQLVGYLMTGDPGYISSHQDARSKITRFDRAKILEVVLKEYLNK